MHVEEPHKVLIYGPEADRLAQLTLQYPDIETGGDLFGYWTHGGSPVVSYVIGPGLKSRHNLTSFYQDDGYLHDVGTALYDLHGLQHVGEWHSHHRLELNRPSHGDIDTVRSGMSQKRWPRFLLLITTVGDGSSGPVLQNYFLFSGPAPEPEPLRIIVLPGPSPFRKPEHDPREEPRRDCDVGWRPGPSTPGVRQLADDMFKGAWFTTAEGKALLVRAVQQFGAAGIDCRMVPTEDGQSLQLMLPEATLLLGADFPGESPRWVDRDPPSPVGLWSPSTDLAQWYIRAVQKAAPDALGHDDKRE